MSELDDIIDALKAVAAPNLGARIAARVGPELHKAVAKTLAAGETPESEKWEEKKSGGQAYKNAASRITYQVNGDVVGLVLRGPEVWGHIGARGRPVRRMLPDAGAGIPRSVERAIEAGAAAVFAEVTK
jgi:hypothetical protein